MTIASTSSIQAYQLRNGGVRARMAILKMIAAASQRKEYPPSMHKADWRAARDYTLGSYESAYGCLSAGINGEGRNEQVAYYTQAGEYFRNEAFCDEVKDVRIEHRGWFTDDDCNETIRGIVADLPHGRFIAGYVMSMNDERVYFPSVFDDARDAARMADEHARIVAEGEREYAERFHAANNLSNDIAELEGDILAARRALHMAIAACKGSPKKSSTYLCAMRQRATARESAHEAIESIRDKRLTLETDYKGVL